MKHNYTTMRKGMIFIFLSFLLFSVSMLAEVQPDKVRVVPTKEGDSSSEFLIVTHATDSSFSHYLFESKGMFQSDDAAVEYVQNGDYVEYQMISPTGGQFAASVLLATKANPGDVNVSVYKTETETWSLTGNTVNAYNNSWTNYQENVFPLGTLEPGVYYTLRLSWITGVNFNGLSVIQTEGSTDISLSDLKINGTTIEGFDTTTYLYTVPVAPEEWIESIEAVTNDEKATVSEITIPDFPEDGEIGSKTTMSFTVTSESQISQDYTLNFITPISIYDGVEVIDNAMRDLVYFNKGVNLGGDVLHSNSNGDYLDYYVYAAFSGNYSLTISCANGNVPSNSYFNVSTLAFGDTTWTLNNIYSQKIPTTYKETNEATFDREYAQDITFYFSLNEYEPTILRIYSQTDQSSVGNIYGYLYGETFKSIDATLSDLQVDGATIDGFDPDELIYNVALPTGTASAIVAATPSDAAATIERGTGTITLTDDITRDTISVTAEVGLSNNYMVNLFKPIEISTDSLKLMMGDQVFKNEGANPTNDVINWLQDTDYVEYYIYSATDKDVHLVISSVNANIDTMYSTLYVSTYALGTEWDMNTATALNLPNTGFDLWGAENAVDVKCNLSLVAGEAVKLRLYSQTNAVNTLANLYGLTIVNGATDPSSIKEIASSEVKVWGGDGQLSLSCSEAYLGGTIQVYDVSGKSIGNGMISSNHESYDFSLKGLFIVKITSLEKKTSIVKCIVK